MHLIAKMSSHKPLRSLAGSTALAYLTQTSEGWLMSVVLCDGHRSLIGSYAVPRDREPVCEAKIHTRLTALLSHLAMDRAGPQDVINHVEAAAQTFEHHLGRAAPTGRVMLSDRQLNITMDLLSKASGHTLPVAEVAQACGISVGRLRKGFHACTGRSLRQWRQERRLQECRKQLIETDASLLDVSSDAGFSVLSHFSRVFTQSTGLAPSEWRRVFRSARRAGAAPALVRDTNDTKGLTRTNSYG